MSKILVPVIHMGTTSEVITMTEEEVKQTDAESNPIVEREFASYEGPTQ